MTSPHDDSIINTITTSASIVSTNDESTQDVNSKQPPLTTTEIGTDASLVANTTNASTATHHMVNNQVSTTSETTSASASTANSMSDKMDKMSDTVLTSNHSNPDNANMGASIYSGDTQNTVSTNSDDNHIPLSIRLYANLMTWMQTIPDKFRKWASDDNKNKIDRDRKLAFILTPVFLFIISNFFSITVSYIVIFSFMMRNHLSFNDAINPASAFYNKYLGIIVAVIAMFTVMFSPAVKDVLSYNGGYHASLKPDKLTADMHTKDSKRAIIMTLIIGVFGGMLVWIIHTLLINGLVILGADGVAVDSNTSKTVVGGGLESSNGGADSSSGGAIGYSTVGIVISVVWSILISPFFEELIYRGFISRSLVESSFMRNKSTGKRSAWQSLIVCIICGLWFGVGHITGADNMSKTVFLVVFMTCFGAVLTWLSCVKYKSIWPGLLMHITYNLVSLAPLLLGL